MSYHYEADSEDGDSSDNDDDSSVSSTTRGRRRFRKRPLTAISTVSLSGGIVTGAVLLCRRRTQDQDESSVSSLSDSDDEKTPVSRDASSYASISPGAMARAKAVLYGYI